MTALRMTSEILISAILLLISFIAFVFTYNKAVRDMVVKKDLDDLKDYVDQQDRSIHFRITENNEHISEKLDIIITKLK